MSIASNFPTISPSLNLSFALTKQLDSRVTFTRASTGTYYNGVTTAKAEENLVTYSQEFDNASWTKNNLAVSANNQTAPDGTATAETLTANAFTGQNVRVRKDAVITSTFTMSVFAKAGTHSVICVQSSNPSSANNWAGAVFDLSAGTVTQTGAGSSSTLISSSITSFGNSWYRCVITVTLTTYGTPAHQVCLFNNTTGNSTGSFGFDPTVTFAGTETVFLWGAQLEQRSVVTAYTATTTQAITNYIPVLLTAQSGVPRFDHNPTTDESLGLLIEESRTNLVTYSEQFDNAAWTKTGASVTANTAVSPDGTVTADSLIEDATLNAHRVSQTISVTSGVTYTISVFAKASTRTFVQLFFNSTEFGVNAFANFNLSTGVLGTVGSASTAVITSVGNGWYRCSMTAPATATGAASSGLIQIVTSSTAARNENYTGDGTSGLFLWGAQAEAGAFATSYIQTVAATVTRAADAASMTGTNFSSWFSNAEGTMYVDVVSPQDAALYVVSISDGTNNNRIELFNWSSRQGQIVTDNVDQALFDNGTIQANFASKIAIAYATNNSALSLNAGAASADTSCLMPVVNRIFIGGSALGGVASSRTIKKLAYYPMRVTNAQLQALTS